MQRFNANFIAVEKMVALALRGELDADLGIDDVADNERPGCRRVFYRGCGGVGECFVGDQNVQQDVGIDGGDHQLAAANIVHELIDRGVAKLGKGIFATAAPFRDADLLRCFPQDNRAIDDFEFDLGVGAYAELLADIFRDRYLAALTDFHIL